MASSMEMILNRPLFQEPKLRIIRQPKKRGYRFRYHSEGQTHGGIPGEPNNNDRGGGRIYPHIRLEGYRGKATVVLTIVTAEEPYQLHAHSLIVDKQKKQGFMKYQMDGDCPSLALKTVAIQHVVREKVNDTMMDRILQSRFLNTLGWTSTNSINSIDDNKFAELTNFVHALKDREDHGSFTHRHTAQDLTDTEVNNLRQEAMQLGKKMDLNVVRFCFQVFLQGPDGRYSKRLDPVYSDKIFDGKTKQGAALKIIRISKVTSTVSGDEEVWIIADKLNVDDIQVRFFEETTMPGYRNPWEDFGKFSKTDVIKQVCLIFRTPPYHNKNIEQPVNVNLQLRRKTDTECMSDPQSFKYTPIIDRYGIGEKRRKEIPIDEILKFSQPKKRPFEQQPPMNTAAIPRTNMDYGCMLPNQLPPNVVDYFQNQNFMGMTAANMLMNIPAYSTNAAMVMNIPPCSTNAAGHTETDTVVKEEVEDMSMMREMSERIVSSGTDNNNDIIASQVNEAFNIPPDELLGNDDEISLSCFASEVGLTEQNDSMVKFIRTAFEP